VAPTIKCFAEDSAPIRAKVDIPLWTPIHYFIYLIEFRAKIAGLKESTNIMQQVSQRKEHWTKSYHQKITFFYVFP